MEKSQAPEELNEKAAPKDYSGGIVFAIILIFTGVLFLLNNLEVLPWSIWTNIWRFWPVFLILIGLQIVLGRSKRGSIVLGIISLLIVGAIALVVVAVSNSSVNAWLDQRLGISFENMIFFSSPEEKTESFAIYTDDYQGVNERLLSIKLGAGTFSLEDEEEGNLLDGFGQYFYDGQQPVLNEKLNGEVLELEFTAKEDFDIFAFRPEMPIYSLVLGQKDIKTSVDISLGAGKGNILCEHLVLGDVKIELGSGEFTWETGETVNLEGKYELDVGAGSAELKFTDQVPRGSMDIDVGAGSVVITLPGDVSLDIDYEIGAGVLKVNGDSYHGDGKYTGDGYESSAQKLMLNLEIGAGKVEIVYLTNPVGVFNIYSRII